MNVAEVLLGLWGEENPNGEPVLRRLLHPCWKSSWAPVLHHTESCALLAATQKSGQQRTDGAAGQETVKHPSGGC